MTMSQPMFPHLLKGHCVLNPRGTLIADRGLLSLGHRGRGNFWAVQCRSMLTDDSKHTADPQSRESRGGKAVQGSGTWCSFYECLFSPVVSHLRHVFLLLNLIFPQQGHPFRNQFHIQTPPNQLHIKFCFCQVYLNQLLVQIRNWGLERNVIYITPPSNQNKARATHYNHLHSS